MSSRRRWAGVAAGRDVTSSCAPCPQLSLLGAVAVVVSSMTCATAHAYRALADVEGSDAPIVWGAPRVTVSFAPPPEMSDAERALFERELDAALRVWSSVDCAGVELAVDDNGDVRVELVEDWAARGFDEGAAGATDVVLATAPGGGAAITGAVIHLDAGLEWGAHPQDGTDGFRDLRAVLVHELGHALGLAHPCEPGDPALACTEAMEETTMYPLYRGPSQAALSPDDVNGVCTLYPRGGELVPARPAEASGCMDDPDCDPGEWCVEGGCRPDLRYGGACDDGDACLGARCVAQPGGGVCTYECASDVECPAHTGCARVAERDERVCAPAPGGCSAAPGRPGAWWLLALLGLVAVRGARRTPAWRALACVAALALGACGDGAGVDGGSSDAGVVGVDAGGSDGGTDAGTDAGPERCPTPGEMRVGPCGFCGMGTEQCSAAGVWEPVSACLGEGECGAGATETMALDRCGEQQRICLATCEWTDWETTTPVGECEPDALRLVDEGCPSGQVAEQTCNATCTWEETRACHDPCGGTARTSPEASAEVCVPAGPFVRGSTTYPDTQPVAEVFVSAFYIDRYPVTNDRYRACVTAGVCPRPLSGEARVSLDDPTRGRYPVNGLPWDAAVAFCGWDGGRRLPTEAEWEKAVRGPAPRTNVYPWDGDEYRCDLVPGEPVCELTPDPGEAPYYAIDELPGSRSYFGTFLQYGGVLEWVSDYYLEDYFAAGSLTDPTGPTTGTTRVMRGVVPDGVHHELANRRHERPTPPFPIANPVGFRCARSAP